ncbi:uncharacterized protein LOC126665300 [Mercurialis annua]|uniref:uncharacterized protein LOC126665300 n=1 Tax=Mercurialis annua TaxID=3986 RepID=UPI002160EC25|nr:uncharacterized protein LOC126665300 [Mercurialis annua]
MTTPQRIMMQINNTLHFPSSPHSLQLHPQSSLQINLHYANLRFIRGFEGRLTQIQPYTSRPVFSFLLPIPPYVRSDSSSCHRYFYDHLSQFLNLDYVHLRRFLARHLTDHLLDLSITQPYSSFSSVADVEVIHEEIINLQELAARLRMSSLGDGDVLVYDEVIIEEEDIEPTGSGVSTAVLMKLKAESFSAGESGGGDCAICLEEFGGDEKEVVVIKMPSCGHSFHENCIFRWLQKKKSCPMCRRQVQD